MILMLRPDDWNLPVLVHVAGAMALVASITVAAVVFVQAWRTADPGEATALQRFGARTLLFVVLPSFIVMRLAAQWAASREGLDGNDVPSWIDYGFVVGDPGALVLLIAIILSVIGVRRSRDTGMSTLTKVATALSLLLIVAYVFVIWAMTTKPS